MDLTRQAETMIDLLSSDHTEEDDIYQKFHANDKKGYASFYKALEKAVAEKKTLDTSSLETLYEKIAGYREVKKLMPEDLIPGYSPMWLAAKTLENDPVVLAKLKNTLDTETVSKIDGYRKGAQGAVETGGAKFSWIDGILAGAELMNMGEMWEVVALAYPVSRQFICGSPFPAHKPSGDFYKRIARHSCNLRCNRNAQRCRSPHTNFRKKRPLPASAAAVSCFAASSSRFAVSASFVLTSLPVSASVYSI